MRCCAEPVVHSSAGECTTAAFGRRAVLGREGPRAQVIANDVRGVQQVAVTQHADGTSRLVGVDHPGSKLWLVQPLLDDPLGVTPFEA